MTYTQTCENKSDRAIETPEDQTISKLDAAKITNKEIEEYIDIHSDMRKQV